VSILDGTVTTDVPAPPRQRTRAVRRLNELSTIVLSLKPGEQYVVRCEASSQLREYQQKLVGTVASLNKTRSVEMSTRRYVTRQLPDSVGIWRIK